MTPMERAFKTKLECIMSLHYLKEFLIKCLKKRENYDFANISRFAIFRRSQKFQMNTHHAILLCTGHHQHIVHAYIFWALTNTMK